MPPEHNPADEVPADKESYEAWEKVKPVMVTMRCSQAQRTELHKRAGEAELSLNQYLLNNLFKENKSA